MEVEDEIAPLIIGFDGKKVKAKNAISTSTSSSKREFLKKSLSYVILLCIITYLLIRKIGKAMDNTVTESVIISMNNIDRHSSTFGGVNNIAHPGGAKAAYNGEGIAFSDITIPESPVPHAIKSLNRQNIVNLWGNYVHDEFRSPYASHLYDKSEEFLEEQQTKYLAKMKAVREEWGAWDMQPHENDDDSLLSKLQEVEYKDITNDEFSSTAWQMDEEYVDKFLMEGKALVKRVYNGVLAEYGSPPKNKDGTALTADQSKERDEKWKIHISDEPKTNGIAVLSQVAMDGLVRKLLHAMITQDEFYTVLGGHSAAAGHGNNFQQNRIITYHHLLEPVFDKLGMRLMSRNMAQGGVGTLQSSLAGSDIYGEADIIEWDSAMTERPPYSVDMYNKQAILSGERVPLILHTNPTDKNNIMDETNNTAWIGYYLTDKSMLPETKDELQALTVPNAARYQNGFYSKEHKYNAICWEPRKDVELPPNQLVHPTSQVGWHPGNRDHQWSGRKLALIVLKGLETALDVWKKGIEKDGFPLAESYWHVGDHYKIIRNNLRYKLGSQSVTTPCEELIHILPRACRVPMHGFGMWQPLAHMDYHLFNIIAPALNGYKPTIDDKELYSGFDLLPLNQAVPDDEVDAHLIAIATTRDPPTDLDHSWNMENKTNEVDGNITTRSRRWLIEASNLGIRAGRMTKHVSPSSSSSSLSSSLSSSSSIRSNKEVSNDVIPGRGWSTRGWRLDPGFCDGSAMSSCNHLKGNTCMMYGQNDNHMDVQGNGASGWLVLNVPKVKEGILIARMEWWCGGTTKGQTLLNTFTKGWTEIDDGKTLDTTPYNATKSGNGRRMNSEMIPDDFEMDIAIDGKIIKVMKKEEWSLYKVEPTKNCAIWPLLDDKEMAERNQKEGKEGEPMEVGIRYRSKSQPTGFNFCFSHLYYA